MADPNTQQFTQEEVEEAKRNLGTPLLEVTTPAPTPPSQNPFDVSGKPKLPTPSPYDVAIKEMDGRITDWTERRRELQEQDETAKRRANSMQMIAGLSDGLAGLANLIGVAHGGSNIDLGTGALTPLQQKVEAARLERKADIKSIDDRLDQYANQLLQMRLAKGNAEAAAAEKAADRQFTAGEKAKERQFTASENEKNRTAEAENTGAKLANDAYQKALDRANAKEVATIRSEKNGGSGSKAGFFLTGEDGTQTYYEMDKARAEAIMTKMGEAMSSDLANENASEELKSAWDTYQKLLLQERVGVGADEELEDARNKVINLSPYMRNLITYGANNDRWSNNRVG